MRHAGEVDLSVVWNLDFWGKPGGRRLKRRAPPYSRPMGPAGGVSPRRLEAWQPPISPFRELDLALDLSEGRWPRDEIRCTYHVLAKNGSHRPSMYGNRSTGVYGSRDHPYLYARSHRGDTR